MTKHSKTITVTPDIKEGFECWDKHSGFRVLRPCPDEPNMWQVLVTKRAISNFGNQRIKPQVNKMSTQELIGICQLAADTEKRLALFNGKKITRESSAPVVKMVRPPKKNWNLVYEAVQRMKAKLAQVN